MVPIDQVINLGKDIVVIADEVCADTDLITDAVDADQDKTTSRGDQMVVDNSEELTRSDASHNAEMCSFSSIDWRVDCVPLSRIVTICSSLNGPRTTFGWCAVRRR